MTLPDKLWNLFFFLLLIGCGLNVWSSMLDVGTSSGYAVWALVAVGVVVALSILQAYLNCTRSTNSARSLPRGFIRSTVILVIPGVLGLIFPGSPVVHLAWIYFYATLFGTLVFYFGAQYPKGPVRW